MCLLSTMPWPLRGPLAGGEPWSKEILCFDLDNLCTPKFLVLCYFVFQLQFLCPLVCVYSGSTIPPGGGGHLATVPQEVGGQEDKGSGGGGAWGEVRRMKLPIAQQQSATPKLIEKSRMLEMCCMGQTPFPLRAVQQRRQLLAFLPI